MLEVEHADGSVGSDFLCPDHLRDAFDYVADLSGACSWPRKLAYVALEPPYEQRLELAAASDASSTRLPLR